MKKTQAKYQEGAGPTTGKIFKKILKKKFFFQKFFENFSKNVLERSGSQAIEEQFVLLKIVPLLSRYPRKNTNDQNSRNFGISGLIT